MRRLGLAAALLGAMVVSVLAQEVEIDGRPEVKVDRVHTKWIEHVMREISTIRPGMTRRDLAPLLAEDGGMQFRKQGRYVYAHCPYIKVDLEFSVVDEDTNFSPDDKIVKVSRPYLEYPVSD